MTPSKGVRAADDLMRKLVKVPKDEVGKTGKAKKATKKKPANKSTTKRGAPIAQPTQSIDDAIAAGVSPRQLDELVKQWGQYNMQEAARQAKEATEAMASSVQARRRQIAKKGQRHDVLTRQTNPCMMKIPLLQNPGQCADQIGAFAHIIDSD